jgi:hypothetical protein
MPSHRTIVSSLHIAIGLVVIGLFGFLWYSAAALAPTFKGSFVPDLVAMFAKPVAVLAIALGVLECTSSVALLRRKAWSRYTLSFISTLQLVVFPIGTAVSVYTLWVLWQHEASASIAAHRRAA